MKTTKRRRIAYIGIFIAAFIQSIFTLSTPSGSRWGDAASLLDLNSIRCIIYKVPLLFYEMWGIELKNVEWFFKYALCGIIYVLGGGYLYTACKGYLKNKSDKCRNVIMLALLFLISIVFLQFTGTLTVDIVKKTDMRCFHFFLYI